MIPQDYITAWSRVAPWASQRQVEQDLIISRALVAIFSDPFLRGELRFRGGTALNKLHFPAPLRYSEDIDLVRTTAGPISPLLDRLHDVLDPWLGKPRFDQSPVAPKLKYTVECRRQRFAEPDKAQDRNQHTRAGSLRSAHRDSVRRRKSVVHRRGRDPDFLAGGNAGDQVAGFASTQQGP